MTRPDTTRERILETAERLFAQQGIDQTSARQINQAAGQRNASAIAYHFGSKDALLKAVLDYRRETINQRRLELLAAVERDNRQHDLHSLVEVLVHPLAERLEETRRGDYYLQVIAQITGHPRYYRLPQLHPEHGSGLQRLLELLQAAMPDSPPALLHQRFGMALRQTFHELADFQRVYLEKRRQPVNVRLFIHQLDDVIAGIFTAPVSAETRRALDRSHEHVA